MRGGGGDDSAAGARDAERPELGINRSGPPSSQVTSSNRSLSSGVAGSELATSTSISASRCAESDSRQLRSPRMSGQAAMTMDNMFFVLTSACLAASISCCSAR